MNGKGQATRTGANEAFHYKLKREHDSLGVTSGFLGTLLQKGWMVSPLLLKAEIARGLNRKSYKSSIKWETSQEAAEEV